MNAFRLNTPWRFDVKVTNVNTITHELKVLPVSLCLTVEISRHSLVAVHKTALFQKTRHFSRFVFN